jgi:hypothetical protein
LAEAIPVPFRERGECGVGSPRDAIGGENILSQGCIEGPLGTTGKRTNLSESIDRTGSPPARVRSPPPAEGRAALAGIRKTLHFQFGGTMMTDPSDLMRRAAELTDRADHEESIEVRDRLLRMAAHYVHIAESEEWLAAHPISIGSVTGLLDRSAPGQAEDDDG